MNEQCFRGSVWQFWVAVAVAVLAALRLWIADVSGPGIELLLIFFLWLLFDAFHPDGGMSMLVVADEGLRIEPLLGGQRFVRRIAWRDMHRVQMGRYHGGVLSLLFITRHDHSVRRIRLDTLGKPEEIFAAIRQHVDIDPQALTVRPSDIGNRVLHVIGVAVSVFILTLAVGFLLRAWHI